VNADSTNDPKPSLRKAIDGKCRGCSYDPLDRGTWRQQVDACAATRCPLHAVRPRAYAPLASPTVGPSRANLAASARVAEVEP
jgi:hypothetical protein